MLGRVVSHGCYEVVKLQVFNMWFRRDLYWDLVEGAAGSVNPFFGVPS